MTRPSKRQGGLLSLALIAIGLIVGSWSYRNLVASGPEPVTTSTTTTSTSTTTPPRVDALVLYIDENFSDSTWYRSIAGYEPLTDGVVVLTALPREGVEPAVAICRAVSFWRPGDDLRVIVRDARGQDLVESSRGGAEQCRPVAGD